MGAAAIALLPLTSAYAQLNVLFVVNYADAGGPVLQITDQAIRQRLQKTFGATVTLVDDNSGPELFVAGRSLVVVSSTVNATAVSGLETAAMNNIPLLNMEPGAFEHYKMVVPPAIAGQGGSTNFENLASQGIEILPVAHPLTAGLSPGVTSPYNYSPWDRVGGTNPGVNATVAARIPGTGTVEAPTRATVFGYEANAVLADGVTTHLKRRTGLFVGDDAEGFFLNATGAKLFDAAVAWTANIAVPAGLPVGDANGDLIAKFADYKIWKSNTGTGLPVFNFGAGGESVGNFNHDNLVNLADRTLWEAEWLTGDISDDLIVNGTDVNQVVANWHSEGIDGDANLDMTVDIFDIARISENWLNVPATAASQGAASAVPEPKAVELAAGLAVILGIGAFLRRRATALSGLLRTAKAVLLTCLVLSSVRSASALDILVVTGDAPTPDNLNRMLIVGDQFIVNRLQNNLGATVQVIDQDIDEDDVFDENGVLIDEGVFGPNDYMRAAAVGKDLVIITRNVDTAKLALTFALRDNPILLFHDDLLDEYRFAGAEGGDQYTQQINITGSGNVLTAGLPNQTTNFYLYNNFRIGGTDNSTDPTRMPTASAITAAVRTSSTLRGVVFGYDHGSTMAIPFMSGADPFTNVGRRTFFGGHALSSPVFMTPNAWALFDRAVLWTADEIAVFSVPEPSSLALVLSAALGAPLLARARKTRRSAIATATNK